MNRREFLKAMGAAAVAVGIAPIQTLTAVRARREDLLRVSVYIDDLVLVEARDPMLVCKLSIEDALLKCRAKAEELGWTLWKERLLRFDDRMTFATRFEVAVEKVA